MRNHAEFQDEVQRDSATRFCAEQYISTGYYLHFHRNMEIYGVVNGRVTVTVAGQRQVLENGQMAVVNGLENHNYEIEGNAEVFYFNIGTMYLLEFQRIHPQKRLPRWLMDAQYNQKLYDRIKPLINTTENVPELKRIGIVCQLFSDIIDYYGLADKQVGDDADNDLMPRIIQYIYDHYSERITLETVAEKFYISPKALSKRLKKHMNVDFRVFVNDIRIQRAIQMLAEPQNRGKTVSEIAAACGFTNIGTFYRSYERNIGYRKTDSQTDNQ